MTTAAIEGHPALELDLSDEPTAMDRLARAVSDPAPLLRRASGLGWFSLGLGFAELVVPGAVARLIGARGDGDGRRWLRMFGAREIVAGLGILSGRQRAGWLWARVAGDVLDLAALGRVSARTGRERSRVALATAAVAGVTLADALTAVQLARHAPGELVGGIDVKRSVTIKASPTDVYDRFRQLESLPRFMTHLESVTVHGEKRSTWRARAPLGTTVEWEAEITEDIPDVLIAWRSLPGASVPNGGSVRLRPAPGNRGTELHVHLKYDVPGGELARVFAVLFGEEPGLQVAGDLLRFKQMMELGDVVDSDASIHQGRHPGRPSHAVTGKQVRQ